MRQVICPLDGKPCEQDCPDRYIDQPEGGCMRPALREWGNTPPHGAKRPLPSSADLHTGNFPNAR